MFFKSSCLEPGEEELICHDEKVGDELCILRFDQPGHIITVEILQDCLDNIRLDGQMQSTLLDNIRHEFIQCVAETSNFLQAP
jgi:hypothetical protein